MRRAPVEALHDVGCRRSVENPVCKCYWQWPMTWVALRDSEAGAVRLQRRTCAIDRPSPIAAPTAPPTNVPVDRFEKDGCTSATRTVLAKLRTRVPGAALCTSTSVSRRPQDSTAPALISTEVRAQAAEREAHAMASGTSQNALGQTPLRNARMPGT